MTLSDPLQSFRLFSEPLLGEHFSLISREVPLRQFILCQFIIMATSNAKKRYDEKLAEYELAQRGLPIFHLNMGLLRESEGEDIFLI